jgi:hypothetical protein
MMVDQNKIKGVEKIYVSLPPATIITLTGKMIATNSLSGTCSCGGTIFSVRVSKKTDYRPGRKRVIGWKRSDKLSEAAERFGTDPDDRNEQ